MSSTNTAQKNLVDRLFGIILDKPTPPSLEVIAAEGERAYDTLRNQRCYIYELLTKNGRRYQRKIDLKDLTSLIPLSYAFPRLPTGVHTIKNTPGFFLRKFIRPNEENDLNKQRQASAVGTNLMEAIKQFGIEEYFYEHGFFGIKPEVARTLLYAPAATPEEADEKINSYHNRVNEILAPLHLRCEFKIRPLIKGLLKEY